ncbi:hypothetical protein ACFPPD_16830 [Cohnella suwonensis]|uniref:Uncharacterized protein n=1 Tax=Cohnella suwonensis TaxID=696072 RepID=A0ABW0LWX2_9BACL
MSNETNETTVDGSQTEIPEEKMKELIGAVHHNGTVALKQHFDDVEGQVMGHQIYGPIFVYQVKDEQGDGYACGFFLRELIAKFQQGGDPSQWMASFYVDLMKTPGGKLLPTPPQTEDAAKALIDNVIVPQCIAAVKEEFAPEEVYAGLALNEEHGPVLEAGFPSIQDGNNVCAMPLHVLMAHQLLNREPSELLVQGLYKIRIEHGLE